MRHLFLWPPAPRGKRLSIFLVGLVLVSNPASAFRPSNGVGIRAPRIQKGLLLSEDDANGSKPVNWKRTRSVDYPSFAYQPGRNRSKRVVKFTVFKEDDDDDILRTLNGREPPARSVSIPGAKSKKQRSLFDDILDYVVDVLSLNTSFDAERISDSAKRTRLLNDRSYARREPFAFENIAEPPSLSDLSPPPSKPADTLWISSPFRLATFLVTSLSLPYLTRYAEMFITVPQDILDEALSKFSPGISILYGTFVSLTLSILYKRQQEIQANVAMESSLLTVVTRNMLNLFRKDKELAIEAGQCAADQIRTLVRGSRGGELMLLMYSDPYARLSELIEFYEDRCIDEGQSDLGVKAPLIGTSRDILKDLNRLRANRLSEEALALPPTHFVILTVLTLLILFGYVVSILPTVDASGNPPIESCLFFGILCTVYILFYNFANDLNNPFQGVYQLRRSATASHLLEAKWLIANHPLLRGEVDFEEVEEDEVGEREIRVRSPGLGDLRFERDEIFPDSGEQQTNNGESSPDDSDGAPLTSTQ